MTKNHADSPSDTAFRPESLAAMLNVGPNMISALSRYGEAFLTPFLLSAGYFRNVEAEKLPRATVTENIADYMSLGRVNLELAGRAMAGALRAWGGFQQMAAADALRGLRDGNPASILQHAVGLAVLMEVMAVRYPEAVRAIEPEFGFHFERESTSCKVAETDRFILYQVRPTQAGVSVRSGGKPVLILPPYVLGANILGFLPGEQRSYAHCFANQGVPTYIRILKDIQTTEALQLMTGEDDARDTRFFCETLTARHGAAVTLNGYCQGGFSALCNLLSGTLDGLVDAFITCVAPMDGTRSKGLSSFLADLPQRFNHLDYGTKTLANGNRVADGQLMGWVYKLKSIEEEFPVSAFFRDLMMVASQKKPGVAIGKTAAALNYWLGYERFDLPLSITQMSFASFTTPIADDGTLPVRLFGRPLTLNRIREKNLPWLICYGLQDNLVEPAAALAPLDWVGAEVTAFPKGHVAMATSWSHPTSAYALHTRFGEENSRGPVRFHLDLEAAAKSPSPVRKRRPDQDTAGARPKDRVRKTTAKRPNKRG